MRCERGGEVKKEWSKYINTYVLNTYYINELSTMNLVLSGITDIIDITDITDITYWSWS